MELVESVELVELVELVNSFKLVDSGKLVASVELVVDSKFENPKAVARLWTSEDTSNEVAGLEREMVSKLVSDVSCWLYVDEDEV